MVICILHVYDDNFDKEKNHDEVTCMHQTQVTTYAGEGSEYNQYTTKEDKFGFIQFHPTRRIGRNNEFIYVEVTIVKAGPQFVTLGVGFDLLGIRYGGKVGMVGWWNNSIGYHGDDGNVVDGDVVEFAKNVPEVRAPPYGVGDTAGAAWNTITGEIFFTLNGRKIDEIVPGCKNSWIREYKMSEVRGAEENAPMMVPTVSVDDEQQCEFMVNTGNRPFLVEKIYDDFKQSATKALVAARVMLHNTNNASDFAVVPKNVIMEILEKGSPDLTRKEIDTIIEIAEDKSNLHDLDKEAFFAKVRPNANLF